MLKKILFSFATLAVALPVGAQVGVGANADVRAEALDGPTPVRAEVRTKVRAEKQERMNQEKEHREEARMGLKVRTQAEVEEMRKDREDFRAEVEARKEAFVSSLRERDAQMKAEMEQKRTELRERASELKDEKKAEAVVRVADNMATVNARVTTAMGNQLNKLDDFLVRIKDRAGRAAEAGYDTAEVDVKITLAEEAIASARTAVAEQAANVYAVDFESETTLRADVKAVVESFREDLKVLKDLMGSAKNSVRDALHELVAVVDVATDTDTAAGVEVETGGEGEVE